MEDLSIKFKQIRQQKQLTQLELGSYLNVSKQAIANVESGHSNPSIELISKLVDIFNINLNWLISGQGDMFISNCDNTLELHNNEDLTKNIDTFKERFQKLVDTNNLNSYSLSKKTNIRESRCEELYIGKKLPNFEDLHALKSHFDVSLDWLLYGETPNATGTGSKNSSTQKQEPALSAAEIEFIRNLMKKSNS